MVRALHPAGCYRGRGGIARYNHTIPAAADRSLHTALTDSLPGCVLAIYNELVFMSMSFHSLLKLINFQIQGGLLSQLVRAPQYTPIVNDLEQLVDLIATKQAVLNLGNPDWAEAELISHAREDDGVWYDLRQATRDNSPMYLPNPDHGDVSSSIISLDRHHSSWYGTSPTYCHYLQLPLRAHFFEALD